MEYNYAILSEISIQANPLTVQDQDYDLLITNNRPPLRELRCQLNITRYTVKANLRVIGHLTMAETSAE